MMKQRIYHNAIDHPVHAHYTTTHFENAFIYYTSGADDYNVHTESARRHYYTLKGQTRCYDRESSLILTVEYSYCSNYTFLVKTKNERSIIRFVPKKVRMPIWIVVNLYLCSRPFPITPLVVVTLNQGSYTRFFASFSYVCVYYCTSLSFYYSILVVGFFISFICCGGE